MKSEIAVHRAETIGSETALMINGTFSIEALNTVTAGVDEKQRKTLTSETTLKIDVIVPPSSKVFIYKVLRFRRICKHY